MRQRFAAWIVLALLAAPASSWAQQPETEPPPDVTDDEPPRTGRDEPLDPETEQALDQLILMLLPSTEPAAETETLEQLEIAESSAAAVPQPPVVAAALEERERPPFWGRERGFVGGMLDLGFLFVEPRFHFGYGVPHQLWFGGEVNPIISGSGLGLYAGLRGAVPWGDLRLGGRYRFNWTRSFLEALDGYDQITLRDRTGPNANYLSLEGQLSVHVPVDHTAFVSEVTGTYVVPIEQGAYVAVYEDTLRVITVTPGWIWSVSLGWRFEFGPEEAFYIEPGAELVHLVEREQIVFRAGLRAGIRMWPDLEVRLIAMPAWAGADNLGGAGGHSFLLGFRYRWATDTPRFGA
jgi:hypothetical protein